MSNLRALEEAFCTPKPNNRETTTASSSLALPTLTPAVHLFSSQAYLGATKDKLTAVNLEKLRLCNNPCPTTSFDSRKSPQILAWIDAQPGPRHMASPFGEIAHVEVSEMLGRLVLNGGEGSDRVGLTPRSNSSSISKEPVAAGDWRSNDELNRCQNDPTHCSIDALAEIRIGESLYGRHRLAEEMNIANQCKGKISTYESRRRSNWIIGEMLQNTEGSLDSAGIWAERPKTEQMDWQWRRFDQIMSKYGRYDTWDSDDSDGSDLVW